MGRQNVNKWIWILSGFQSCMLVLEQSHGNLNNHTQVLVMAFVSFLIQKLAFYQPSNSLNVDSLVIVVKQCIIYSVSSITSASQHLFHHDCISCYSSHQHSTNVCKPLQYNDLKKQEIIWYRKNIGKVTQRKTIQSMFPLGCLESYKKIVFEKW